MRLQVGHVADDLVVVGVHAEGGGLHLLAQPEERLVLAALPLGDDHRALGGHLVGLEQAVVHAVGFQPQGQVDLIGGHGLEVGGPIQEGEGVPIPAVAGDGFIQHLGRELRACP